jgi:glutathione synthase/RimK-type ligase-like ATP-grasp enzyme
MTIRIIPYRAGSESASLLARALGAKLGYKVWRGVPKERALNLGWGNRDGNRDWRWINNPLRVSIASDKLTAFNAFKAAGVRHVPYTVSAEEARGYQREGHTLFARTRGGQGGSGIVIVGPTQAIPDAELYTQYVKKKKEFRVHVVNGTVIDVQQKKKRRDLVDRLPERNTLVRNLANGWIFAHEDVVEPDGLRDLGIAAVRAVGLDFGAVDIIWNEHQNLCYVLEVNTAPGLCETTCQKYVDAFAQFFGDEHGNP